MPLRRLMPVVAALAALATALSVAANDAPPQNAAPDPALQQLAQNVTVPEGFEMTIFADNVPNARSLEWTPNGTLFVGSRAAGNVYAIRDDDNNGAADGVLTIDSGLYQPNGVVFHNGALYVSTITQILRYDDIEANLNNPPEPVVVYSGLPDAHHGWKYLRLSPDEERLFFQIGAPCNVCDPDDPRFSTISSITLDGADFQIYASGVRNSVGFDFHPETGELWFTDNGRDSMGDNIPPDELNHAPEPGLHFGFPYCHGDTVLDPGFGFEGACEQYVTPVQNLGPHVAALGMRFYDGEQFPAEYENQIFIAEHGSWDRSERIGYRVTLVRLDEDGTATSYEDFATGWLQPDGSFWGRPVDLELMPDGSMLVSDDHRGTIYRIRYVGEG
ncbi:MAG: PQQ-dependent sugar dehydrogenase [Anaerolineales bacterium]